MSAKQTISTRQFAILFFIVSVSSKIFMLPALLMGISGRDSWLTILMGFFANILVLLFILFTSRLNPSSTLYDVLRGGIGRVLSKVVILAVLLFYLIRATVMISEIKVFFAITVTESLSWQICIIPFLLVMAAMSLKTLRSLGRLAEIVVPIVFVAFVILAIIMAKNTDFSNLMPLFENGAKKNIVGFLMLPIWMTDMSVMTIFLGRIEDNVESSRRKSIIIKCLIAALLSLVVVLYFNVVMYSTYSYAPNLLDYGHNVTNMLLYPTGTYNYGRFDLVIFSVWMLGMMINVALLFYIMCRHLSFVTNVKNNYCTALIIMIALFGLGEFIFADELRLYAFCVTYFNYFAFAIEVFFPILVFLGGLIGRKRPPILVMIPD